MTKTFKDLKEGDYVCRVRGHSLKLLCITKVTPKYIYIEDEKYKKDNGFQVPRQDRCFIKIPTKADIQTVHKQSINETLEALVQNRGGCLDKIPDGYLELVAEDLKNLQQGLFSNYYLNKNNSIRLNWCIDDVRETEYGEDLTDEQCMEVLKFVERRHDCNYGISWLTLEMACEEMFKE